MQAANCSRSFRMKSKGGVIFSDSMQSTKTSKSFNEITITLNKNTVNQNCDVF